MLKMKLVSDDQKLVLEKTGKAAEMITVGVRMVPDIYYRLDHLSKVTKKSKGSFLKESLLRCLEDFENELNPKVSYK